MEAGEIRELSPEERDQKLSDLQEEIFNLRFQHGIGQLENAQKMKQTKHDIARVKTVIKEISLKNKTDIE